jgi:hypothetical protein
MVRVTSGDVTLHFGFAVLRAWRVNILEEKQFEIQPQENTITLYVKPFEIVTLMIQPEISQTQVTPSGRMA